MKLVFFAWIILFFSSCEKKSIYSAELEDVNQSDFDLRKIKSDEYQLFFFLSPQCPLSENYTKSINEICKYLDTANWRIQYYVVIPTSNYSNQETKGFISNYKIYPQVILDKKCELAKILGASATPEVFLLNAKNDVLYSGAIDNWAVDLGQKRQVITERYLMDALDAVENGKAVPVKRTEPVGCFIEYN